MCLVSRSALEVVVIMIYSNKELNKIGFYLQVFKLVHGSWHHQANTPIGAWDQEYPLTVWAAFWRGSIDEDEDHNDTTRHVVP